MTTSSVHPFCAPDASWTELHLEQKGMLAICPALPSSNLPVGQALIIDEAEDHLLVTLDDLLTAWKHTLPGENFFALVHEQDFSNLADGVPRVH